MSLILTRPRPSERAGWWLAAALWALALVGIGVAIALPEPLQLVLGAAALFAGVLTLVQPLVAVPALLFAVPFGGLLRGASDTTSSSTELAVGAADLLVAVLGAAWLAHGIMRRRISVPMRRSAVAIGLMVCLAALSIGYAGDKGAAVKEAAKWLELLLVLLVVIDLVRGQRAALWIVGALFLAGAIEAGFGAVQFATGEGPDAFNVQGALRAFGHFEQPNPYAGYLTTMLPLAVMMALTPANPRGFRWFAAAASLAIATGIGLSQSRGAWLGGLVAASTLVVVWSQTTRRLLVPALVGAALAVTLAVSGLLPAAVLDRVAQTIEYFGVFDVRTVQVSIENWAVVERMAHWQAGWYMFLDHPWLGVGAGNYADAYPGYFVGPWPEALGHAHNYYINMLAELGVVGGGLLLAILGLVFGELGGPLLRSEQDNRTFWRAVLAGCVGGLVVFCVHNLFDSLFVHGVNVQIGVLIGLGLVAAKRVQTA